MPAALRAGTAPLLGSPPGRLLVAVPVPAVVVFVGRVVLAVAWPILLVFAAVGALYVLSLLAP